MPLLMGSHNVAIRRQTGEIAERLGRLATDLE